MSVKNPTISIILSVYNAEIYLKECITSIINQTYTDFEFIIVDDCSTDSSLDIIRYFYKKDKRIRIINNKKNLGLTKSLNIAAKISLGKYIARVDADEYSNLDRLKKQLRVLENSNIGLVGSKCQNIYPDNKRTNWIYSDNKKIKENILYRSPFPHGSALFYKKIFIDLNLYNEKYYTSQDLDLWIRFSKITDISMIDENLIFRYINKDSISKKNKFRQFRDSFNIRLSHAKNKEIINVIIFSLYYYLISLIPDVLFHLMLKIRRKL